MPSMRTSQLRAPAPSFIAPMLARPGALPRHPDWALEVKWDGMRAQVRVCDSAVPVRSRHGRDWTAAFPELAPLADNGHESLLLDGELVCLDAHGRPDFGRLRARLHPGAQRAGAHHQSARLMIFDLPYLDGQPLWRLPYRERRRRLDALSLEGPAHAASGDGHLVSGRPLLRRLRARASRSRSRRRESPGLAARVVASGLRASPGAPGALQGQAAGARSPT